MEKEILSKVYRSEYKKITAVLTRHFGLEQIEIAEDIVSESFILASESWKLKGIPDNPVAWLYTTARNKTIDYIRRKETFKSKVEGRLVAAINDPEYSEPDFSDHNIRDSTLQMIFAVCHPSIPEESQIALALKILCGFTTDEIASAFITSRETVSKRIYRAKEVFRTKNIKPGFEKSLTSARLEAVLKILYLLFNEGYYSNSSEYQLRKDLCLEAMRLALLLTENERTNLPPVNALLGLMCFHSSRFEARMNSEGEAVLYEDQDKGLWNRELIDKGIYYLVKSAGSHFSKYHIEASLAFWHSQEQDSDEKWKNVLLLYNYLLTIEYSPVAALNRTYALSKVEGPEMAIVEAEKLSLSGNVFYHSLLGELYSSLDTAKSLQQFHLAVSLSKSESEKKVLMRKMSNLDNKI